MSKLYLVDLGYIEPTVIYELVPRKLASLQGATLAEVERYLHNNNAKHIILDSAHPREVDEMVLNGFNVIRGRLPELKDL